MRKKSNARPGVKPLFRESDFAGRPAQEQADLSGSLNHLSHQLDATRKLLREMESRPVPQPGEAAPQQEAFREPASQLGGQEAASQPTVDAPPSEGAPPTRDRPQDDGGEDAPLTSQ